jgi:hypothetical protein
MIVIWTYKIGNEIIERRREVRSETFLKSFIQGLRLAGITNIYVDESSN